jgi:hypothetical protein
MPPRISQPQAQSSMPHAAVVFHWRLLDARGVDVLMASTPDFCHALLLEAFMFQQAQK